MVETSNMAQYVNAVPTFSHNHIKIITNLQNTLYQELPKIKLN